MRNFIKKNRSKVILILAFVIMAVVMCIYSISKLQIATNRVKGEIKAQLDTPPDGYTAITDVQGLKDMTNNLSGKYILMGDIDLNGEEWTPIGLNASASFKGIFDGNFYTISNLTINSTNQYVGLFGYITAGTVQNVTLSNVNINGTSGTYVGALAGYTTGSISNVVVSGNVTGKSYTGGIIGQTTGTITGATNNGNVTGKSYTGGIVGKSTGAITNTINNGEINANADSSDIYTGGIVGYSTNTITETENKGKVTGETTSNYYVVGVGGIVGHADGEIRKVKNKGEITGKPQVGGIAGYSSKTVEEAENYGEIRGVKWVGGIIGNGKTSSGTITKAINKGKITVTSTSTETVPCIGGIIGNNSLYIVQMCYSSNEIVVNSVNAYVGGVIGDSSNGTVKNTYSTTSISGTVAGTTNSYVGIGGIIGHISGAKDKIENSYAIGRIDVETTSTNVGGLIGGKGNYLPTVTNSYYSPKLTGYEESAGGTAKGVQELLYRDAYENWDFTDIWAIEPDGGSLAYLKCFGLQEEITRDEVDYETRVGLTRKGTDGASLTGGTYQVKNSVGEIVRQGGTNSKGIFWIKDLEVGTYTVEEITAPVGYAEDKTVYSFKMTEEGIATDVNTNEEITLEIVTEPLTIEIQSTDNETNLGIQGITIALYNQDGSEAIDSNGKQYKGVTNAEGKVSFIKVTSGTYKYKQTTTKTGYRTNETEYTVTIEKNGNRVYAEENNGIIENQKIRVNVAVTVQDLETKEPLMDAKIGLYTANNVPVKDAEGNNIVLETNENGQVIFEGLEVGRYYYKEIEAPEAYDLNTSTYSFNVNQDETITYYNNEGIIYNQLTRGTLIIRKRANIWNTRLSGAVIGLYDEEGNEVLDTNGSHRRATTNESGYATFKNVEAGTYGYRELVAPWGYKVNQTMYKVQIDEDYKITYLSDNYGTIYDDKIRSENIVIGTGVPDVVIGLYDKNGKEVLDEDGNPIKGTADKDGNVTLGELEPGDYIYKVTEVPEGYRPDDTEYNFSIDDEGNIKFEGENGGNITIKPIYTNMTVHKVWSDTDAQKGKRPANVKIQLKNGATVVQEKTIGTSANEDVTFTNLTKYDENGDEIVYTPAEAEVTAGDLKYYTSSYNAETKTITNTFRVPSDMAEEKISITVHKVWSDTDAQKGKRPANVKIQLKNGATVVQEKTIGTSANEDVTFTNLKKYDENGDEIVYTPAEAEVTAGDLKYYVSSYNAETKTITNTFRVPSDMAEEKTSMTVHKVWSDTDAQKGKRPANVKIQLKNGATVVQEKTIGTSANEDVTFTNLTKYDENGDEIVYTPAEAEVTAGDLKYYTSSYNADTKTITNTFRVPSDMTEEKTSMTVHKVWSDTDAQKGKRPANVKIQLKNGATVVQEKTIGTSANEDVTFTNLKKYDENGDEIVYTPAEAEVTAGDLKYYVSSYNADTKTITNTFRVPSDMTEEKTSMTVHKVWSDTDAQKGKRPANVKIQLKNGATVVQEKTIGTSANEDITFTNLTKYDENGDEIVYTPAEAEVTVGDLKYYTSSYNADTKTITNTFRVPSDMAEEKISITVHKVWSDTDAQKGKRPANVKIQLKNGNTVVQEKTIGTSANEDITFTNLTKYDENGDEIVYTPAEAEVTAGDLKYYVSSYNAETKTITNTFRVPSDMAEEKISMTVHKVWSDTEAQKGKRPANVKIQLKNGATVVQEKTIGTSTNEDVTFTNLTKYDENGDEIVYTPAEAEVTAGDLKYYTSSYNADTKTITNTFRVPSDMAEEKTSMTVHKVWVDTEAQKGKRPANIKIQLKNGNTVVQEQTITTEENKDVTFTDLTKYDENGDEIVYTPAEAEVTAGDLKYYVSSYNADTKTITNTFRVPSDMAEEKTSITVHKVWSDTDAQKGKRPANVKIQLKNGNTVVQEKTIGTSTNEDVTFTNLTKYDENGDEIVYTPAEAEVTAGDLKYYVSSYNAETKTITNTFKVPSDMEEAKTRIVVYKHWVDTQEQSAHRPENIKIVLKTGTTIKQEATIAGNADKEVVFEDLPVYDTNGDRISYTIQEQEINEGDLKYYVGSIRIDQETGAIIITNTFTLPEDTVDIIVTKEWNDANNANKKRPDNIILKLTKGNEEVVRQTVTGTKTEDTWTHTFTRLPKYDENGNEINYLVDEEETKEKDLKYYTKTINQETKTITNTYIANVSLRKVRKNTQIGLQGAEIALIDEQGVEIIGTTNGEGYVTFIGLEKGKTYTYKEKKAPLGYELNEETYTLTVNQDGSITYGNNNGIIENERTTANVTITKYEAGTTNPVSGAKIALYDENGNETIGENGKPIVLTTGENGQIIFEKIEPGTYKYKEIEAPLGYVLNENEYTFTIDENGNVTHGENNGIIYNEKIRSNVEIRKYEEGTTTPVEGAIIGLFDKNGNVLVGPNGEQIKAITNAEGKITILNLEIGTYKYKELQAPEGYVLNEEMYEFTVNNDGSITYGESGGIIYNKKVTANVEIRKYEEGTTTPVEGAKIGLYDKNGNEVTNKNGAPIILTTNQEGKVTFTGLTPENYVYKEIEAPEGYELNTNVYTFTIDQRGNITYGESGGIIYNKKVTADVEIRKYEEGTTTPVEGAEIGLFDENKNPITNKDGIPIVLTTGQNGKVTYEKLSIGTYYYKETKAPTGYELNETIYSFTINKDGSITYGTNNGIIYNKTMKYSATITKYIEGTTIPVEGAEIGLYDKNGNPLINTEGNQIILTTNQEGKVTYEKLEAGTYYYKETKAPLGYELNEEMYNFTINKNGTITHGENGGIIYNKTIKTNVIITKYIIGTTTPLKGAEITLYDAKGNEITTKTTSENGQATYINLSVGTYYYKETKAPKGYSLNEETYTFTVNEDGSITYGENNGIIYNDIIRANVVITKYEEGTTTPVEGAEIGLFDKDGNPLIGENGQQIKATTGKDGKIRIINLRIGTYSYKELKAPEGYIQNNTMYTFEVDESGNVIYGENRGIIYNTPITTDVEIIKLEKDTNKTLKGAKIELYNKQTEETAIQTTTTIENGKGTFKKLRPGTYYYKETKAPVGYIQSSIIYTFTVNVDGTITYGENEGKIYNEKIHSNVVIIKYEEGTMTPVEGAEIGLFDENGNALVGTNQEQIKATTGKDGKITILNLKAGTYSYKELKAPEGYILNSTLYKFTINENGEIIYGENKGIIYNAAVKVNVGIIKKDKETQEELEGAEIGLYNKEGKEIKVVTTDENGIGRFIGLKPETYYYKEEKAPNGYNLNEETYTFTVNKDGTVTFGENNGVIYNEKTPEKPEEPEEPKDPTNPDNSDKPEIPDIPNEPTIPDLPIEPIKPEGPKGEYAGTLPKTGETVAVLIIGVIALSCSGIILTYNYMKMKKESK